MELTWGYLMTTLGAATLVMALVQLFKAVLGDLKINSRIVVYLVSLVICELALAFSGAATGVGDYVLKALEAVYVALAAMGEYDLVNSTFTPNKADEGDVEAK